jgi:hypothetical protein
MARQDRRAGGFLYTKGFPFSRTYPKSGLEKWSRDGIMVALKTDTRKEIAPMI